MRIAKRCICSPEEGGHNAGRVLAHLYSTRMQPFSTGKEYTAICCGIKHGTESPTAKPLPGSEPGFPGSTTHISGLDIESKSPGIAGRGILLIYRGQASRPGPLLAPKGRQDRRSGLGDSCLPALGSPRPLRWRPEEGVAGLDWARLPPNVGRKKDPGDARVPVRRTAC